MNKYDSLAEAGAHYHDKSNNDTLIGGNHTHLLDDMKTILDGGAHSHELQMLEGMQGQIGWGGAHVHKAVLPDGKYIMTKPIATAVQPGEGPTPENTSGGRHKHEVSPDSDVMRGGQHIHTIQLPDGTVHKTLGHDEIKVLIEKGIDLPSSIWDGAV